MCGQNVGIKCAEGDASDYLVVLLHDLLVLEKADQCTGLIWAEIRGI